MVVLCASTNISNLRTTNRDKCVFMYTVGIYVYLCVILFYVPFFLFYEKKARRKKHFFSHRVENKLGEKKRNAIFYR